MEKRERINILVVSAGITLILLIGLSLLIKPILNKKNESKIKSASDAALIDSLKKAKKISGDDLRKKILFEKNSTLVIDLRDKDSFDQEHLPDSLNIPYDNIQASLSSLDKSKTYILIDDGLSFQAAYVAGGIFNANDFPNVFYLDGGFIAWKNKINLTVSIGDPTSFIDQSKVVYINSDDLKKAMETDNSLYILDVRDKEAFDAGRIRNAINIPLVELEKRRNEIPKGKKIILCDDNGILAFQAGVRLYDFGFFGARVFSDGIKTWTEKGYEIVK